MTMTRRMIHDLGCTCGRHFRRVLYHAIDVTQQSGLRYAVLGGVLNSVQCPSCERVARVNLPFLYRDGAHGRLVYVYPEKAREQAGELRGQIVQLTQELEESAAVPEGLLRPTLIFGLERLADLIGEELGDDEQPGSVAFDVRPGVNPERAARVLAGRVALQAGGYVHSWREGGRLHVQILGPRARLEAMTMGET